MSVYVGIDVHRKRSQVAVIDQDGEVLANRNVPNGVTPILSVIGDLPSGTPAAFEAAFGWGWLVELLEDYGFEPHLVHPLQCKAIASARLKNDKVDAAILAQLLRADLLPEAWIAPPPVRQPLRVGIIGLAARHVLDMRGVADQDLLKVPVLEQRVIDRHAVDPGRLHRHVRDPERDQPPGRLTHHPVKRLERPLDGDPALWPVTGHPHRDRDLVLADVDRRTALIHDMHACS